MTTHEAIQAMTRDELERMLAQRENQLAKALESEKLAGPRTLEAKWLDPKCWDGCQSLVFKAQVESLQAELASFHAAMQRERKPDWEKWHMDLADRLKKIADEAEPQLLEPQEQVALAEEIETLRAAARELRSMALNYTLKANFVPTDLEIKSLKEQVESLEKQCASAKEWMQSMGLNYTWPTNLGEGYKSPEEVAAIVAERDQVKKQLQENHVLLVEAVYPGRNWRYCFGEGWVPGEEGRPDATVMLLPTVEELTQKEHHKRHHSMLCPRCTQSFHQSDIDARPEQFWRCPFCHIIEHAKCRSPLEPDCESKKLIDQLTAHTQALKVATDLLRYVTYLRLPLGDMVFDHLDFERQATINNLLK